MEEGIDSSGILNESLALKAFLRSKREERRRGSSIPSEISFKERSAYTLSYDPERSFQKQINPSRDYKFLSSSSSSVFEENNNNPSEEKLNQSFNSMHSLINESFQEKIDYQRKLREQQSELLALRDQNNQLSHQNTKLLQTIVKLKQKQLPIAFSHVMKTRRRLKVTFTISI